MQGGYTAPFYNGTVSLVMATSCTEMESGAFVPMPFRSSVTTGMDTKTKTVINGGIKAGREVRKARVKLSGNVGTGRDS